ncbi:MAG: sodium:proton antiporter [Deltaproteobacteria bacterium HGW-Deltaproteobacteria-21]|nr:MAG: sodium:proton antiporter [Deltaproteobacteria bacterium HGW-Deltaproteobacteria-21]
MEFTHWYLVIGALLILLVLTQGGVRRMPITTAMLYLGLGWLFGLLGWARIDSFQHTAWLEHLSEVAVIVSLFSAGLKLRVPLRSRLWNTPVFLAFGSMSITVGLIALAAVFWIGLPLGAAVILGAVLAPTDPVLASDVQVEHEDDTDRVRFTLTGEAGMNDGTAFPFVMLGLGLLGFHDLGAYGWRWWAVDLFWAVGGGLASGALLGAAVTRLVIYLRRHHREAAGMDDFLALGLIAAAYGFAQLLDCYGFLSVFAAGLAVGSVERNLSDTPDEATAEKRFAVQHAPAYLAAAVLHFNDHLESISELVLVLLAGALVFSSGFDLQAFGFAFLLFCAIRPIAVAPIAVACRMRRLEMMLVSWFGIRGIGSIYYLFYAVGQGVDRSYAETMIRITLGVVSLSILVHGLSVTPLMRHHRRKQRDEGV